MTKYQAAVHALICSAALLGRLPTLGAARQDRPQSVLEGVKELDRPVTYTETRIPLGELIRKVAADTGAPLTAAREVSDEPVAVVVKELRARELLEQLADLLDYRWSRRAAGGARGRDGGADLVIYQDLAARQREEALRQALLTGVEKRFQEDVARLATLATLPEGQIREMVEEFDRRGRETANLSPEERKAIWSSPEGQARRQQVYSASRVMTPAARALAIFVGRLTRSHWAALKSDGALTFSSDPQPHELPLPEEVARLLRTARPVLNSPQTRFADLTAEQQARQREKQIQDEWAAATGYRVTLRLDMTGFQIGGSLDLTVGATAIRPPPPDAPRTISYSFGGGEGANLFVSAPVADPLQTQAQEDTPERRKALEADPVLGIKKSFRPEAKSRSLPGAPASVAQWLLRDLMTEIARIYGVNILSDAYVNSTAGSVTIPSFPAEPIALFTLLDRLAGISHRWGRSGRLIRMRARAWFMDRPREVPLRLVRRWDAMLDENHLVPLDVYAEMALLSDAQILTLSNFSRDLGFRADPEALGPLFPNRSLLRLYAALSPAQRVMLRQRAGLPVSRMLPHQRELFHAALKERNRGRTPPLDLERWMLGSFSLWAQQMLRTVERQETGYSVTMRPVPPSTGKPAERTERALSPGPGAGGPPRAEGGSAVPAPAAPGGAASPPRPTLPGAAVPAVTRHVVGQVTFRLQYGSDAPEGVTLMVAPLSH